MTTTLTTAAERLIELATLDLLRYDPQAGYELCQQGSYERCELAGLLQHEHGGKVFELEPDTMSGGRLAWVRVTEYGLNLIGRKSKAQILASELGERGNDGLIVAVRSWSKEAGQRAEQALAGRPEVSFEEYDAALGTPERIVLTGDGGHYAYEGPWCRCPEPTADQWAQYQVWSQQGMIAHGFLHTVCRYRLQAG